jgi:hypothetical protein
MSRATRFLRVEGQIGCCRKTTADPSTAPVALDRIRQDDTTMTGLSRATMTRLEEMTKGLRIINLNK